MNVIAEVPIANRQTPKSKKPELRRLIRLLADLLVQDHPSAAHVVLERLTAYLNPHQVVALLVEEYGVKGWDLLKSAPAARGWLADLWSADKQRYPVAKGEAFKVYRRAVKLTGKRGTSPRHALARLVKERGLRVFQLLRDRREDHPDIAAVLDLARRRKPGRPKRTRTRDAVALALSIMVKDLHIPPVKLLGALGRDPSSGSSDHVWLSRRRKRGDALRTGVPSDDLTVHWVKAWCCHCKNDPLALLGVLLPYLVQACPHVNLKDLKQRDAIEAKLRKHLEPLLTP